MTKFPRVFWILGLILLTPLWGCHHKIAFEDIDYKIDSPKQDRSILLIIEPQTLNQVRSINSWMTGAAHSWDAYPGQMLKQVADVEFPQMFQSYSHSPTKPEGPMAPRTVVLHMDITHYDFSDFHALVSVRGQAYDGSHSLLFDKTYTKDGIRQGAKMFWGGAFGMKSAIRQSSFDAYKKIFDAIRQDLARTLSP